MIVSIGKNTARILIKVDPTVSTVDITGFPIHPVLPLDAARVPAKAELIVAAVPPPAINANDHCVQSFTSVNCEANNKEPATVANGTDMVSRRLSTKGI